MAGHAPYIMPDGRSLAAVMRAEQQPTKQAKKASNSSRAKDEMWGQLQFSKVGTVLRLGHPYTCSLSAHYPHGPSPTPSFPLRRGQPCLMLSWPRSGPSSVWATGGGGSGSTTSCCATWQAR
jgi:hypothetical protein